MVAVMVKKKKSRDVEVPEVPQKPKHRFRLLASLHVEGHKVYKRGDVVYSERNLARAFKHKFRRLADYEEDYEDDEEVEEDDEAEAELEDEEEEAPRKKKKIRRYKEDEELLAPQLPSDEAAKAINVTKRWPEAKELDLRVYKGTDGKYYILDSDGDTKNSHPLSRKQVSAMLEKLAEE